MVYCIGLTGTIASGKSTVANLFAELGVHILSADHSAKQLTLEGAEPYKKIIARYGKSILDTYNQINRKKLRELIFTKSEERIWLEELLHPQIREQLQKEAALCSSPYCIIEIPLLKDKNHYPFLQRVLLILSPLEEQIKRVMERDQCTQEQAMAIIATQPSIEERLNTADDILVNDQHFDHIKQEVNLLHTKYLQLATIYNPTKLL